MMSLGGPKTPLNIAGRHLQLRRRLIITDANLRSGITAAPSTWEEPRHNSPSLFEDTTRVLVPATQEISPSQPLFDDTICTNVPETQEISSSQPLFDDTIRTNVPETQEFSSSQSMISTPSESSLTPRSVISESQHLTDSLTFYDSPIVDNSLLPLRDYTSESSLTPRSVI